MSSAEANPATQTSRDDVQKAMEVLGRRLDRQLAIAFHVCAHCGLCNDTCHYALAIDDPKMVPAYKADQLRKIYKRRYDWLARLVPRWVGAKELDAEAIERLVDVAYGACTMCRRCVVNCPFGVDTALIVRTARAMLNAIGRTPRGLQEPIDIQLRVGNNGGVETQDFVETIQWWEEQLQAELHALRSNFKIPLDKVGARVMCTLAPRELRTYPLTAMAMAKILHAAGENWTLSSRMWDATNFALFSGDDAAARQVAQRTRDEAVRLGVEEVIWSECGHGYRAFRWEAEGWLGERFPFRVRALVELIADYIAQGRIKLDPSKNSKPVTYHDPCNLARNSGIVDAPRYILKHAVTDFREMKPHGVNNFCCGGGGGVLFMSEFTERRKAASKIKAEQIKATGAKIVATSCHNCMDQLTDLNSWYRLGVEIHGISELVADALVLPCAASNILLGESP
jgi:Fe-S oxidoreductase